MAATANATIQLTVPDGLRGRVMSVYTTVFAGSVPIGGLAMGALASAARHRRRDRRSAASCRWRPASSPSSGGAASGPAGIRRRRRPGARGRGGLSGGGTAARPGPERAAVAPLDQPLRPARRAPAPRSSRRSRTRCSAPVGRRPTGPPRAAPAGAPRCPDPASSRLTDRRRPAVGDGQGADGRLDRARRARAGGRTAPSCR